MKFIVTKIPVLNSVLTEFVAKSEDPKILPHGMQLKAQISLLN